MVLGFTDHDRELAFEGIVFRPDSGLSARAVVQGSGLSVDNTEAAGALSDSAITEIDLMAVVFPAPISPTKTSLVAISVRPEAPWRS